MQREQPPSIRYHYNQNKHALILRKMTVLNYIHLLLRFLSALLSASSSFINDAVEEAVYWFYQSCNPELVEKFVLIGQGILLLRHMLHGGAEYMACVYHNRLLPASCKVDVSFA